MGISTQWVHMFHRHRDDLASRNDPANSVWLSIGTLDYEVVNFAEIRDYGNFDEQMHNELIKSDRKDMQLHKKLCSDVVAQLGYGRYVELDINDRADIVWDMNTPIASEFEESFDALYDGGSLEHIFNPYQGAINMLKMAKTGGKIIHSQGIGDITDHGYWTFSPSFLIDFYQSNGCKLRNIFIMDIYGEEFKYVHFDQLGPQGGHYLAAILPPSNVFLWSIQLLRHAVSERLSRNSQLFSKYFLKAIKTMFGPRVLDYPNYSLIAIFDKEKKTDAVTTSIQQIWTRGSVFNKGS